MTHRPNVGGATQPHVGGPGGVPRRGRRDRALTLAGEYRDRLFFFYSCGDHGDLHSFPTRRSSDLPLASSRSQTLRTTSPISTATCRPSGERRSEEHTSELQSQSNLVCRLLLEKKKQ